MIIVPKEEHNSLFYQASKIGVRKIVLAQFIIRKSWAPLEQLRFQWNCGIECNEIHNINFPRESSMDGANTSNDIRFCR